MNEEKGQVVFYRSVDGHSGISVQFEGESASLTQQMMAELFDTTKQNISLHIQNIFEKGELMREATVKQSLTVQKEGNREAGRR